ncbi:hypothetical protein NTGBS_220001 [Candidatus Nitrotoga sp. BS]|uniref:hypothetical protein n=1 Tax=Candidatus Nitrotoga sp. BS TaxID=2890408 RepID=UPI001EF1896D|nr:hypothetical protein [Candidatus Nitrotoga sp. BS]CAH1196969.1 hypothetical protein NTGBS_220001 [Candidatus Nitrotoga sp. BS]
MITRDTTGIVSLTHSIQGMDTVTSGKVITNGGIVGTRRPKGAPWQVLVGRYPVSDWTLQLENTDLVRRAFKKEAIKDLVLTLDGVTPAWPE